MALRPDYGALVDIDHKGISDGDDCWVVTGYGSIFNNTDLGNDVVVPGAFAKSLREHGMPLLLFNHKMEDAPIGTIVDAKEDKRGLWFKAELPKDDSFVSGRIVPQLKRRGLRGTSIGYKASQKETRKSDGARLLKEIRLYEISVVNMPMNPLAAVETVKGIVPFQDLQIARDAKAWDPDAAMKRLRDRFGDGDEMRRAFLFADEEKGERGFDKRLLIADVDDTGCITANPVALYKSAAAVYGGLASGDESLPEGAEDAIKVHLDRYFARLNLDSPAKSLSVAEFEALSEGEREARLRGLGVSRALAKKLLSPGQREADRKSIQREAGSPEDAHRQLLSAFEQVLKAGAIKPS